MIQQIKYWIQQNGAQAQLKHVLILLVGLLLAGCKVSVNSDNNKASVRVLHTSPNAPNIDVKVNDVSMMTNAAFKVSSGFQRLDAGRSKILITATITGANLVSATHDFSRDRSYTVIVGNRLSAIEAVFIEDDSSAPLTGQAKVRLVHSAPDAAAFDIYITAPGISISTATPRLSNVAFKSISSTIQLSAGNYQIRATPAGTKNISYDSGSVVLTSGSNIVLVAVEQRVGASPISLIGLATDINAPRFEWTDNRAKLQLTSDIANAPNVDLYIDHEIAYRDLVPQLAQDYVNVQSGTRRVSVKIAGTAITVFDDTVNFVNGYKYKASISTSPSMATTIIKIDEPSTEQSVN
jgi:hypothetical protein